MPRITQGVVLRIEPNEAKDSKFQKFAPDNLPRKAALNLYQDARFREGEPLWRSGRAGRGSIVDRIIYAKTNAYKFEK